MRDQLKPEEYFDKYLKTADEVEQITAGFVEDEVNPYPRRLSVQYSTYQNRAHRAVAAYSMGADSVEVRRLIDSAFDTLEVFVRLGNQDVDYFVDGDGGGYSGGLESWYRDLAWCILYDLPRARTDVVMGHLALQFQKPEQATDALVNRFVEALGYPGREDADRLLWPDVYGDLYACFDSQPESRVEHLSRFVKSWYKNIGKIGVYFYNYHKNKHDVYFGYWCFEAKAVAKILNIRDDDLRGKPHYPFDAGVNTPDHPSG